MSWYILKDRRHLGPFDENQLRKYFQRKEITDQDFLISKSKADKGELSYSKLSDLFPHWAHRTNVLESEKVSEAPQKPERALGSFTEDEILKSEVSRVFMESLDTVDLLKGSQELTKTGVGSPSSPSKKPPKPMAMSKHDPLKNSGTQNSQGAQIESFQDIQKSKANKLLFPLSLGFMFLVLATFPFLGKAPRPQKESVESAGTKTLEKSPVQTGEAASAETNSSYESGRSKLTVKVPELVDPRTRQLEAERDRERDRREREIAEERERRDRRSPADQGEKAPELNPLHPDIEEPTEEPMPENEDLEAEEGPIRPKGMKVPAEGEDFETPPPN